MKKFVCIVLISTFFTGVNLASVIPDENRAAVVSESADALSVRFDLSGIERHQTAIDGRDYIQLSMEGEGCTRETGMPVLPAVSRYVVIPPDVSVELVVTRDPGHQVHAMLPPAHLHDAEAVHSVDLGFYRNGELYPPEPVVMSRPILIRYVRMVMITAYPVQYDPRTETYIERSDMEVELRYGNDEPINPANVSFPRIPSPQFQKLIESISLNPAPHRDDRELVEARGYNEYFLMLLQDDINRNIEDDVHDLVGRLVEWKRRSGNKVDMLRIPGNRSRNPQYIEDAIQEYYDELLENHVEPFDNILLIGEDETTPYSNNRGQQGFDLMLVGPTHRLDTSPWVDHYDVKFAQLDGDDLFPDVAISRFHSGDRPTLAGGVNKTINYEAEPYLEDTDWYTEAIVIEQYLSRCDDSNTRVCDYCVEALVHNGFEVVAQWRRAQQGNADPGSGWTADRVNERIGFIAGRAKHYTMDYVWGHSPQNMFRAVGVFPIAILTSGHGEWAMETLWWVGREEYANRDRIHDIRWAKGGVAATCVWARPSTDANNILCGSAVHAMLDLKLSLGWMRAFAVMNFARTWPERPDSIAFYTSNFGMCGDPAIKQWQGIPTMIEVNHPATLPEGATYIPVEVINAETDNPMPDMMVTVYKGEMNEVEWFETRFTDQDGFCEFTIDPELEGPILITALEKDIYPYQGEIEFEDEGIYLQASITEIDDSDGGNDNGVVNPGETVILSFSAANLGVDNDASNVTGTLISHSPGADVEDNEIDFGDIDAGDETDGEGTAVVHIAPAWEDGVPINLVMILDSDEGEWTSGLTLDPVSFNIEVASVENSGIVPREVSWMEVELRNVGRLDIPPFTARILPGGWELGAPVSTSEYPRIAAGAESGPRNEGFRLSGNLMAIPGSIVPATLLIEVGGEVVDAASFSLQIGEPFRGAPQGPDAYGYICFDDTDTSFNQAPVYDWIEISRDADNWNLRGTQIERFEGGNNNGFAVVELPFTFQYYGEEFDEITVCTNGFLTPGTDENFVPNFQNFPLDGGGAGGAYGMIAPFWDNLNVSGQHDPGIWYAYDEDNGWFVVEWYNVRHACNAGRELRFEVILYNRDVWPNATRDGFIRFQYAIISNIVGDCNFPGMDTPYASVGITSPDNTTSIAYTCANVYPVTSAPLQNGRALFFNTSPRQITGVLRGRVIDHETRRPIEEASVYTSLGQVGVTDEHGSYEIGDCLAMEFSLTAIKQGYNDSTIYDLELEEDELLAVNFDLLHPEFVPSTMQLEAHIDPEQEVDLQFNIRNEGNGPLGWSVVKQLPGGAEALPWERRESYPVGATVGDSRIEGVVYIDSLFYVAGANKMGREDDPNMIYILDHDGQPVDSVEQPGDSSGYGMKDLAWDGNLIWGSGELTVFGINRAGEVQSTFEGPYSNNNVLTWDSDRELLWVGSMVQTDIIGYDRNLEEAAEINRHGFRLYGLAYWPEDPDDCPLYIFHSPSGGRQVVHKMNPENEDTVFVRVLEPEDGGSPGGAFATNQFDVYSWVFMDISNDGADDRIDVWQLDARRDWFNVSALDVEGYSGTIQTRESQEFNLNLNSTGLPMVPFEGMLLFHHNAIGGETIINVLLDVVGEVGPTPFGLKFPADSTVIDGNCDTTLVEFGWEQSIDYNADDDVYYEIHFETLSDSYQRGWVDSTIMIDLIDLSAELELDINNEFAVDWWVTAISGQDRVESNNRFVLLYLPNAVLDTDDNIPVEFGLQSIYPSPFNSMTTVRFGADRSERIKLQVFDLLGRKVIALYDNTPRVGYHHVVWDAVTIPSGIYILRLEAPGREQTAKIALVR